ncbi:MAG TPA: hypothetical protein VF173_12570 [Thermoanaerobaculia bacterium]|nr:hypothetical protein [Thermoanaerobaculia bacterium]
MKRLVRAFAVFLVLGAACLPASSTATPTGCRYYCGTTVHQTTSTSCCTQTFTCPNGQQAQIVQVYNVAVGGWIYCP